MVLLVSTAFATYYEGDRTSVLDAKYNVNEPRSIHELSIKHSIHEPLSISDEESSTVYGSTRDCTWDATNYSSGIYFIESTINSNKPIIKKVVLLK